MDNWKEIVSRADGTEIHMMLDQVLKRHEELYPRWELSVLSLDKEEDRNAQISRVIALLDAMRDAT